MCLSSDRLRTTPHLPIDYFFSALATDLGDQAIGIILSGTASDGTQGCIAIKVAGGITFAQDQKSAKYHDMPENAIRGGSIDFVLPPKDIARELARIQPRLCGHRIPAESLDPDVTGTRPRIWMFFSPCCRKPWEWISGTTSKPPCNDASSGAWSCTIS